MRREICSHGIEVDADCPECVKPYRVADPSEPPKNAAYWKRKAKRYEEALQDIAVQPHECADGTCQTLARRYLRGKE